MTRWLAAVALLVMLAGCSGFAPAGSDAPSLTPAPVPDTATPPPDQRVLAPGLTGAGIVDPGRLAGAHRDALAGRSFALVENRTVEGPNGTLVRWTRRLRVAEGWSRYGYVRVAESAEGYPVSAYRPHLEAWFDGRRTYFRGVRRGEVRFSYQPGSALGDRTRADRLLALYAAFDTRVRTADGGYRVVGTSPADEAPLDVPPMFSDARNATFVAVLDADGRVSRYRLTYEATFEGERVRVAREVRFEAVGATTIEPPDWYGRARNATD